MVFEFFRNHLLPAVCFGYSGPAVGTVKMRRMPGWICAFPYPLVRSLPRGYLPKWPNMPALSQWLHLLRGKHKPKSMYPQDVSGRLQPAPYSGACLHCLASTADAWASYPNLRYLHGRWLRGGEDLGVTSHVRLVAVPSQSATAGHLPPQGPACKEASLQRTL